MPAVDEAETAAAAGTAGRDPVIDGFRALAVCGVIAGHALAYRYEAASAPMIGLIRRFAGPLSDGGVQLFFVISGYIITSLMLREEAVRSHVDIAAFYARRVTRILPPLLVMLGALWLLARARILDVSEASIASALLFSCNTGFGSCGWWVAHTWSLAVEEQFYIVWPLLFIVLGPAHRSAAAATATLVLMFVFAIQPHTWHSNALSFACIAAGATYATTPRIRSAVGAAAHPLVWVAVAVTLMLAPLTSAAQVVDTGRPLLLTYLLFTAGTIAPLQRLLSARPLQWVGMASYSLYLWQQLFLAVPHTYSVAPLPIILLPIVASLSVLLVERPFIRLGHRLSRRLRERRNDARRLPGPVSER